jgi:FAD/FMN-containing dehydrogenase
MSVPPGLTENQFSEALNAFRAAIGEAWVFTIDDHIATYKDYYSPYMGTDEQPIPSAAVAPENVEGVQAILKIANDYQIPLWIISTGKNYGYGGPDARVNGSVILDLKRMNRILEINEDQAYALVEPGVSHYDLWLEIQRRGMKLWVDGPSPAYSSIIANTIERGVGYGLLGERINAQCGMEVVLATGEVVRTGMGAMANSTTWQQYKYGLGPWVDGMFSQSNLGVVTKMGIWLIPEPQAFRSAEVYVKRHEDIIPLIDTLRPLRISNVIANSASASTNYGGPIEGAHGPGGGLPPNFEAGPPTEAPGWRARLGFYGYDKVIETNWEQVQDEFSVIKDVQFRSKRYTAPYQPDGMLSESKLAAGIPSFQEAPVWEHGGTFTSMVIPFTGKEYWDFIHTFDDVYKQYKLRFFGGPIHFHAPHSLITLAGAPLSKTDGEFNKGIIEMVERLTSLSGERGWGEYRTPLAFMDTAARAYDFNDNALLHFNEKLKDALDPKGILAPGKNGIWPKHMREEKG